MTLSEVLAQQLLTGLSNGMIIALIALGYTMVYGILELINFAHGDLFTLGAFFALTLVAALGGADASIGYIGIVILMTGSALFCGSLNWIIDRFAYRPVRKSGRLAPLVSAIGVSFILLNVALFWGGLPLEVFSNGTAAASPKSFPSLLPETNLFGDSIIYYSMRDLFVVLVTLPLMAALGFLVKKTTLGKAMRAVAQNPTAASLMGIDSQKVIGFTFFLGGALAGAASVMYALYNNTIHFQMGFRVGMDAFTAAVLGGIGNLPGAVLGGIVIGIIRAMSDQYLSSQWTTSVVFGVLVLLLMFKPTGLLGSSVKDKV